MKTGHREAGVGAAGRYRLTVLSLFLLCLLALGAGCTGKRSLPGEGAPYRNRKTWTTGGRAVFQLYCPDFGSLPRRSKIYAYHLYRACVAGRGLTADRPVPREAVVERVVTELESALGYAPPVACPALIELVRFLETGAQQAYQRHCELRRRDTSQVVYRFDLHPDDGFGGMVLLRNRAVTRRLQTMARADSASRGSPIPAAAFDLLCGTGDFGPFCPVRVPTDGQSEGAEAPVLLFNVLNAVTADEYTTDALALPRTIAEFSDLLRDYDPDAQLFVMPELRLVYNRMGGIVDIRIRYPRDFEGQMARFDSLSTGGRVTPEPSRRGANRASYPREQVGFETVYRAVAASAHHEGALDQAVDQFGERATHLLPQVKRQRAGDVVEFVDEYLARGCDQEIYPCYTPRPHGAEHLDRQFADAASGRLAHRRRYDALLSRHPLASLAFLSAAVFLVEGEQPLRADRLLEDRRHRRVSVEHRAVYLRRPLQPPLDEHSVAEPERQVERLAEPNLVVWFGGQWSRIPRERIMEISSYGVGDEVVCYGYISKSGPDIRMNARNIFKVG